MSHNIITILLISIISLFFIGCAHKHLSSYKATESSYSNESQKELTDAYTSHTAHGFSLTLDSGEHVPLADLRGTVILVVNTAAKCGFASQYKDLEDLYQKYKDEGFVVIGVSSNDFNQEIKDESERVCFLEDHFPTTFPLTETVHVTGDNAHPLYQWLNKEAGVLGRVKWNFHKFLIGKNGEFIDWFAPTTKPHAKKVVKAITEALNAPF